LGLKLEAQNFSTQRKEFTISNIGINGVIGGIGALINKNKDQKHLKVFLKGFGQGCLGGSAQLLGKELTYFIYSKENLVYAWPAKIVNSIGSSIAQNAVNNINFWERWHFNLGFIRFDYHLKEKNFQARLFPSAIYGAFAVGTQGKFNLKSSLQTGTMIYENDGPVLALGSPSIGVAMVSSIAIDNNITGSEYYGLMAHEMMHILQYDNMVWINGLLSRTDKKLTQQHNFYKQASKYIYFDFNGLTALGIYLTQIHLPWECRYLEREADHFSRARHWPMCN